MKKNLLIVLIILSVSCSKDEDTTVVDGLNSQIKALNEQITTLQSQIQSLTTDKGSISSQLSAAQASLQEAQNSLVTSADAAADLTERLALVSAELNSVNFTSVNKIDAVGSVSNQTPAQAKQTIYGRWNVSQAGSKSAGCQFNFIEFTDDNYLMQITVGNGEKGTVFGEYVLKEDANGKVSSVDLLFDAGDSNITVAILTNVVVTATSLDSFSATFDVVLTLPQEYANCDAALSGNYTCPKQDPVPETKTTTALSNHGKLIGEWKVTSINISDSDGTFTLEDILKEQCEDGETGTIVPNCTPPSTIIVNFSTFGTYSITYLSADGSPIGVQVDSWSWKNQNQTVIDVSAGIDYTITKLNENSLELSGSGTDEEGSVQETVTFTKS
tara:strand:+ start:5628 stop:6785 length:1158 start_codon:yes stop_codon:yes gene_type:complete